MHRSAIALLLAGLLPTSYLLAQQCNNDTFTIESADSEIFFEVYDSEDPVAEFHIPARFNQLHVQDSVLEHHDGHLDLNGNCIATNPVSEIAVGAVTETEIYDGSVSSTKIAQGAVHTEHLSNGAVTSGDFATGAVGSEHIIDGSVGTAHFATGAVTSDKIKDYAIQEEDIALNIIQSDKIKDGTIQGNDFADQTISRFKFVPGTITSTKIQDNTLTDDKIAFNTITSHKIDDATIRGNDISAGAITFKEIGLDEVQSVNILDGTITGQDIANEAITSDLLSEGSITTVEIADLGIEELDLADHIVNSDKIRDRTIVAQDIALETITNNELGTGAITTEQIVDRTIRAKDFYPGAVTSEKILDGTVEDFLIAYDAVTSEKIFDGTIVTEDLDDHTVIPSKIADHAILGEHLTYAHVAGHYDYEIANAQTFSSTIIKMNNEDDTSSFGKLEDYTKEQTFIVICDDVDDCVLQHPTNRHEFAEIRYQTIATVNWSPSKAKFYTKMMRNMEDIYDIGSQYTEYEIDQKLHNIEIGAKHLNVETMSGGGTPTAGITIATGDIFFNGDFEGFVYCDRPYSNPPTIQDVCGLYEPAAFTYTAIVLPGHFCHIKYSSYSGIDSDFCVFNVVDDFLFGALVAPELPDGLEDSYLLEEEISNTELASSAVSQPKIAVDTFMERGETTALFVRLHTTEDVEPTVSNTFMFVECTLPLNSPCSFDGNTVDGQHMTMFYFYGGSTETRDLGARQ